MKRLRQNRQGVSNVIVVMLSLVLVVIIVANVVLWSYEMNEVDWEKMRENICITDVKHSAGIQSYNPSHHIIEGSTDWSSGSISDLTTNDNVYMTFRSYYSGMDKIYFASNVSSDVDSSEDIGTNSNFSAQQAGPDSIMDTLSESSSTKEERWISPSTHEDPGDEWNNETNAYDEDGETYAMNSIPGGDSWCQYLVLTHSPVNCSKIRYYIGRESSAINQVEIELYNGTWTNVYSGEGIWSTWTNVSFPKTPVSKMRFRFLNTMPAQERRVYVYETDFLQEKEPPNYRLDLEVQWIGISHNEPDEWLTIFGGTMGSEDIGVDVWNGSAWENVFPDLSSGWNNISVSAYLVSSNFTIRFKDGTETDDTIQDSWDLDVTLLHVWSEEFKAEVEFTGYSSTDEWSQLNWTVNYAWTTDLVNVTLQLFNYTLGGYPTSGFGYLSYISSEILGIDESESQTVSINPTHFRNTTGHWKMRIRGIKTTDTEFDLKADWIEYRTVKAGTTFEFENKGSLTCHIVSLWVNNATKHQRYDLDIFINSGQTKSHVCDYIRLPANHYRAKVITDKGNIAIYSGH